MTKQMMPVEQYCNLVREIGIEEAYRQRHRCTGRTRRLALRTLADISEGKTVVMYYGINHGRRDNYTYQNAKWFLNELRALIERTMNDLDWHYCQSNIQCRTSGGKIILVNEMRPEEQRGHYLYRSGAEVVYIKEDME